MSEKCNQHDKLEVHLCEIRNDMYDIKISLSELKVFLPYVKNEVEHLSKIKQTPVMHKVLKLLLAYAPVLLFIWGLVAGFESRIEAKIERKFEVLQKK